ncbi:S24 family peptidase [uncultured Ruminococcus sp.]|uniref:LexA family protein n=1 Tax=uncultured Ruminococcus sp. TaxID=165186 RepID=UPI0025CEEE55|nr:S24 family peptidase [uncultured Ruminococcus sp.]
MDIGKLINKRRTELELTLEDVGNAVGVSKSTVKKWEDGFISNMKRDKIAELAKVLKLNPVSLITGEEEVDDTSDIFDDFDNIKPLQLKRFPLLGEIACGKPIFADEDHESYVMADTDIHADFCLKAKGDSMINARIFDGDVVFIRKMPMVENGDIAAVIIDDEATLKRVYYYPEKNKLILNPENPAYEPLVYINEELNSIRILGKAVCFMSEL